MTSKAPAPTLASMLADLQLDPGSPHAPEVQKAVLLAAILQERSAKLQSSQERRQQRELERMMTAPDGRVTLMQLTDKAFRSTTPRRVADQLIHILDVQGIPRFFSVFDRAMLKGFQSFGGQLPGVSVPMVKSKMRGETANVVLPAETDLLVEHLVQRKKGGLRMNVNFLGEALLGEQDAQGRLANYLAALQLPELDSLSVKISTIYSQIEPVSHDSCVDILCDRMELLYRASAQSTFERPDGSVTSKFVYLDMEESRDLNITAEVLMRTLERPGLEGLNAGIALQAYLPNSYEVLEEITTWAKERVAQGGSPITVRLVKGANMEAERVEASLASWPQAPFKTKVETDANYKRMLRFCLEAPNIAAVQVGLASHNLFDVCYGLVLAHDLNVLDKVQFEMLEGIANHQRRALHEIAHDVLLYAPATRQDEFVNAIGYLIRRLDENTGPENFLRHSFALSVGSEVWKSLEEGFTKSFGNIETTGTSPRRTQNRHDAPAPLRQGLLQSEDFDNEPDTDFSLPQNLSWAKQIIERWVTRCGDDAARIPVVIDGKALHQETPRECYDPSRPGTVVGRYSLANAEQIVQAIACARSDPSGWRTLAEPERAQILSQVAQELRIARADLIGASLADSGKIIAESDPEISEAVDFVEYYAASARDMRSLPSVEATPEGVVVVVSPWNFPAAIPCGGIAAALAAGNTVILKPASHAVLVAYEVCKCFWRGGVSQEALQFAPCSGATGGAQLVASEDVDVVILTGGTDTALRMVQARPEIKLLAETGGKNATVVTAMSDREQAIKHVVASAFGHSGQKCSATALLILEAEVYDDPKFKATLCDAIQSLHVGSAWELRTKMGPTIYPPDGDLERAQKDLAHGESWAVMPRRVAKNPNLWTPGLKWDVQPGSYAHMTEFFGPVLAVLRADNIYHAIELVNQTGYGLTSGLESLDEREHEIWLSQVRAGNLYINRSTTGAIVLRQPFGGMGKSVFGPAIKAGGPNYVAQLMRFRDRAPSELEKGDAARCSVDVDELRAELVEICESTEDLFAGVARSELRRVLRAILSYSAAYESEFGVEHDHFRLLGQDNRRRYLPIHAQRIRVHADDSAFEIFARACAARIAGCGITMSSPPDIKSPAVALLDRLTESWGAAIEFVEETDEQLCEIIKTAQTNRVRYAGASRTPTSILRAVGDTGIHIARAPVLEEGRIELLWYLMEQSISHDYHRYGNLGSRTQESRRPIL